MDLKLQYAAIATILVLIFLSGCGGFTNISYCGDLACNKGTGEDNKDSPKYCPSDCGGISVQQEKMLKVALVNSPTYDFGKAVSIAEKAMAKKKPDLIVFHELAFSSNAPSGKNIAIKPSGGSFEVLEGNDRRLYDSIKRLQELAKSSKTNLVVPIKISGRGGDNGLSAILINSNGETPYLHDKSGQAVLSEISNSSGEKFSFFVGLCGAPFQINWTGEDNFNADLFIRSGWGGGEAFITAAMEYYEKGTLSEQTYSFFSDTFRKIFIDEYKITSKQDLISRLSAQQSPFEWIPFWRKYLAQKHALKDAGFIITSDETLSYGIIGQNWNNKTSNLYYDENYEYIYAEIRMPIVSQDAQTYTCTQATNQTCSTECSHTQLDGTGTCPAGQVCCKLGPTIETKETYNEGEEIRELEWDGQYDGKVLALMFKQVSQGGSASYTAFDLRDNTGNIIGSIDRVQIGENILDILRDKENRPMLKTGILIQAIDIDPTTTLGRVTITRTNPNGYRNTQGDVSCTNGAICRYECRKIEQQDFSPICNTDGVVCCIPKPTCKNAVCERGETTQNCPQDCTASEFACINRGGQTCYRNEKCDGTLDINANCCIGTCNDPTIIGLCPAKPKKNDIKVQAIGARNSEFKIETDKELDEAENNVSEQIFYSGQKLRAVTPQGIRFMFSAFASFSACAGAVLSFDVLPVLIS
ncbi:MAG: hypothetical protein HY544_05090 [Candidatus Diapherotrites archaeon]|uniref:Uncharacterized protein n=1 Tax=Candidatus Iainarchaeum sp. TaxID=3101447 RepID=A0A8T3YKU2_9ARCH|nr:hypothetical protein [Candidatus Diapherotrites archaeon]